MLYLLRHGPTAYNNPAEERIRGWSAVPLSTEGEQVAAEAGERLQGQGITKIWASDLPRTAQTAAIVGRILGLPSHLDHSLRPWDMGIYTGQLVQDVIPVMERHTRNRFQVIPGGESWSAFLSRWDAALTYALRTMREKRERWLLVAHARLLYTLDFLLSGGDAVIPIGGLYPPGTILRVDPAYPSLGADVFFEPPASQSPPSPSQGGS